MLKSMKTKAVLAAILLAATAASVDLFPGAIPGRLAAADPSALPPLVRSAGSGPWSASATWEGGKAPTAGARVQVCAGHVVVYDVNSDKPIRSVHVAGALTFARDKDTRLDVGLIKIQAGNDASENGFDCDAHLPKLDPKQPRPALLVGTADEPIPAGRSALIRLTPFPGMDQRSCPAIVCCSGRMEFHGAPMSRTWVKLAVTASKGDAAVTLAETVQGWRVGDHVIITDTQGIPTPQRKPPLGLGFIAEERVIRTIDGTQVVFDRPLDKEHLGADGQHVEVANLSRNVIVESAEPQKARGHTMYHRESQGSISYAEFRRLGKEGVLGRYPLHYHLVGDTMRGSSVIGASIWDSGNRFLTIHGTNYLVVRDCVGYQSIGHGFFMEDGTEVYNVLDRNLAVQAYASKRQAGQALPFDANLGAGFWWANCLNTFTRNVACENNYGFFFEARPMEGASLTLPVAQPDGTRRPVDVRTLPFVRFSDNETHCNGTVGLNLGEGVGNVGPDARHPFVIRNLKIWREGYYAFRPMAPSVLVEGLQITGGAYGIYHANFDRHVYRDLKFINNSMPFAPGYNGASIQLGGLTVDGLTFEYGYGGGPVIYLAENNPTGKGESHFRNVRVIKHKDSRWTMTGRFDYRETYAGVNQTWTGVPIYFHDYFGPGKTAKVLSVGAQDVVDGGDKYREEPQLTGKSTRAAEVRDLPFPTLLEPLDDLPPTTVITHVRKVDGNVVVRGSTSDNGTVIKVLVNGQPARALAPNFTEWEAVLKGESARAEELRAQATDAAGNVEPRPHVVRFDY
jgi:G8 domain